MCTNIGDRSGIQGSAKGPTGWFAVQHLYVAYDHPVHAEEEHAVLIDLVDESRPGARVAVELSLADARELAERLAATLAAADAYETSIAAGVLTQVADGTSNVGV